MLEVLSDMTMLWISVVITVLLVAAFTKANVLALEWELRTNWKRQLVDFSKHEQINPLLIPSQIKYYRPKMPSRMDHLDQDEEGPSLVVYC